MSNNNLYCAISHQQVSSSSSSPSFSSVIPLAAIVSRSNSPQHLTAAFRLCREASLIPNYSPNPRRHLVISCSSQHGDRKRGRERPWNTLATAGWHSRNKDVEIGKREHVMHTAENLGVPKGREVCVYFSTLPIGLFYVYRVLWLFVSLDWAKGDDCNKVVDVKRKRLSLLVTLRL